MKSSFKYIILLVILSLSGIFVYQLFWINGLYHSLQQQNREYITQAIRNADHVELFSRADFISKKTNKQRVTISQADDRGGVALTTRFSDKDSVIQPVSIIEKKAALSYASGVDEDMKKVLQSYSVKVGDDFKSLGELGLQMQRSLHEIIDTISPVNIAKFDSLLAANLREKNLDLRHFTEIRLLTDSTVIATSVPEGEDLSRYHLYTWKYTTFTPRAFYVYVESTRMASLAGMTGILISSFLILLILVLSFAYMIWFLFHQKTVEQLKDDFTHNVTHELKTPIAISYAAIESIIHYNLLDNREKADKYLHLCHEELERLGGMVEQILSLSLEKRKDIRLVIEKLSLNDLISRLVEQQKIKSSRSFRIRTEYQPEEITLKADRIHLYNIISNLVDNAIKYADKEPEITIRAVATEGKTQIRVQDNGPGIPEEYRCHIFDKFYRIPSVRQSSVKGYGIGLFYVKTMVEKHGGSVTVECEPGKGTCFIITLPQ
ncbi:HAMP domain-containing sensor histidine kinase [Parabacteroides segnis]|uniref:sensor histidine kinase n=1 Tax=Parabacteroides segnis TaxID=2763058 RepID=UPI0035186A0A